MQSQKKKSNDAFMYMYARLTKPVSDTAKTKPLS